MNLFFDTAKQRKIHKKVGNKMARKNGLGRDFMSLLEDNIPEAKKGSVSTLRISQIEPRSEQPRKNFDVDALRELADSISVHGVLQPIIVRENPKVDGTYEIIAGERRWRASKLAGLTEIPVVIFDGDDLRAAQVAIIENVQREDLNPLEEAFGYRDLIERFGLTQEQVADKVGKSRPTITNTMRLLDLPEEALQLLREGNITPGHARALLGLKNPDDIVPLANKIYMRGLSVREIEATVKKLNKDFEAGRSETVIETPFDTQRSTYLKELERRTISALGRKVRITGDSKKKSIELYYEDNDDLEDILRKLCGNVIFDEISTSEKLLEILEKAKEN